MMCNERQMAWTALLLLLGVAHSSAKGAEPTSADVQNAQNQATIATSAATAATAAATVASAQSTAQQALLASQIANQKNEIANIQTAITAPSTANLRMSGTLVAPTVTANANRILADQIVAWLAQKDDGSFFKGIDGCKKVFLSRASLSAQQLSYHAVAEKLSQVWRDLNDAKANLDALGNPQGVETRPPKPASGGTAGARIVLPAIAAASSIANFALNVAAAAKPETAVGTQSLSPAAKMFMSAATQQIVASKKDFYDSDAEIVLPYTGTQPCAATSYSTVDVLPLLQKANCVVIMLERAQELSVKVSANLPSADPKEKVDPKAGIRTALDTLNKTVAQSKTDLQGLFTQDPTSGAIPFNSAIQGEIYATLVDGSSCIVTLAAISSDADTIVRDGTFSAYKLSIATTTTLSWTVTNPNGKFVAAGFKDLSTRWERQSLDE